MSFADAFLNGNGTLDDDQLLAMHVDVMLQSVVPGPVLPASLTRVRASNLGFGMTMSWALSESQRLESVCAGLRERLEMFEPRLASVATIEVKEDDQGNLVEFLIEGIIRRGRDRAEIEVHSRVSLMDQAVVEDTP